MDSPRRLEKARKILLGLMFAASTAASKSSKRKTAEGLALKAATLRGQLTFLPLVPKVVLDVAAALRGAHFRSAPSYLGELRLAHLEEDYDVGPALARTFVDCRRALLRGLGPAKKATGLPLELLYFAPVPPPPAGPGDLPSALSSYLVAEGWLLREIELANSKLGHVRVISPADLSEDDWALGYLVMELFLPVSKSDVRGTGAARRLRCDCAWGTDSRFFCAAHSLLYQKRRREQESGFLAETDEALEVVLFPTFEGLVPEKAAVIRAWQLFAPPGHPPLGGHSARRSGAKRRARPGWSVLAIQHLGRWASVAVLGYIEEALAELAAGPAPVGGDASRWEEKDSWAQPLESISKRVAALKKALGEVKARLSELEAADHSEQEGVALVGQQAAPLPERRFLRAERGGKLHREASHQEKLPAYLWVTGCGWSFGRSDHWDWASEEDCLAPGANLCAAGCDLPEAPAPAASP